MSVRLAVIGAGTMGADHARIVAEELPNAGLQVICDPDASRARAVAEQYGAKDVTDNPETTISREDVDAVIVASPDSTHSPLSLACINAGKRVLCEKPLSQSSDECIKVINAERASGEHFIQLGFMRRYDQSYAQMKRALDNGQLGRALMVHNFHRNVITPAADFTGAMAITNSATHEFDIVRYLLGSECKSISAFQPRRSDSRVAPVVMVLETKDEQLITVEINNNAAYGYDVRTELVGETGSMTSNPVTYTRTDSELGNHASYDSDWRERYFDAYRQQNRAFIRFIESGKLAESAADCWDGYCAAVTGEAGIVALESGKKQAINLIEQPEFYA